MMRDGRIRSASLTGRLLLMIAPEACVVRHPKIYRGGLVWRVLVRSWLSLLVSMRLMARVSRRRPSCRCPFLVEEEASLVERLACSAWPFNVNAAADVIVALVPAALPNTGQYENTFVDCDLGGLKARLRPTADSRSTARPT
jgi:hypothetical protein